MMTLPFKPGDICKVLKQFELFDVKEDYYFGNKIDIKENEIITVLWYKQDVGVSFGTSINKDKLTTYTLYHTFELLYNNKIWYADFYSKDNYSHLEIIKCD